MRGRLVMKLVECVDGLRRVHERRPAPHVDGNGKRLYDVLAGHADARERLGVKADAAVTVACHSDGQSNEFLLVGASAPAFIAALASVLNPAIVSGAPSRSLPMP